MTAWAHCIALQRGLNSACYPPRRRMRRSATQMASIAKFWQWPLPSSPSDSILLLLQRTGCIMTLRSSIQSLVYPTDHLCHYLHRVLSCWSPTNHGTKSPARPSPRFSLWRPAGPWQLICSTATASLPGFQGLRSHPPAVWVGSPCLGVEEGLQHQL